MTYFVALGPGGPLGARAVLSEPAPAPKTERRRYRRVGHTMFKSGEAGGAADR